MPYTPPTLSSSAHNSTSPIKSCTYAGLLSGGIPQPTKPSRPSVSPSLPCYQGPRKPHHHHRRSSGLASPPRLPIPVASFAHDRANPKRSPPARRSSLSSTSSDEEESQLRRDRHLPNLKELRDAIRELPQTKVPSPPGSPDQRLLDKVAVSAVGNLSPEHADGACYDSPVSYDARSPCKSSPDDRPEIRRMVRKKSGEVVKSSLKSPLLRRRPQSLPATPVYPKVVHFDVQLERIRHFYHAEKPLAVSAETSPTDDCGETGRPDDKPYQIEITNFPSGDEAVRCKAPVVLESVYLSDDGKHLLGKVLVKNLDFSKLVVVRFTFDRWQTVSEVSATYTTSDNEKIPSQDIFTFTIKLVDITNLEDRQMLFAIRYRVAGQEFWDNNYGANYKIEFRKRPNHLLRRTKRKDDGRSRTSDDSTSSDDYDVEMSPDSFAEKLARQISSPRSALLASLGESPPFAKKTPIPLPPPISDLPGGTGQKRPTGKAFANRYDFGASLTAAIAHANASLGFDQSGLHKPSSPRCSGVDSYFSPLPQLFRPTPPTESPATETKEDKLVNNIRKTQLSGSQHSHHFRSRSYPIGSPSYSPSWPDDNKDEANSKPPMDSLTYLDFLNSYCFFESGKHDVLHPPAADIAPLHNLIQPQFPTRPTSRGSPPPPKQTSHVRPREESKAGKYAPAYLDYPGSLEHTPDSSILSSPRIPSPQLVRSSEVPNNPPTSMLFHHHGSPRPFDTPGAPSTAIVG